MFLKNLELPKPKVDLFVSVTFPDALIASHAYSLPYGYDRFLNLYKRRSDDHNVNGRPTWSQDLGHGRKITVSYGGEGDWVMEEWQDGVKVGISHDGQTIAQRAITGKKDKKNHNKNFKKYLLRFYTKFGSLSKKQKTKKI